MVLKKPVVIGGAVFISLLCIACLTWFFFSGTFSGKQTKFAPYESEHCRGESPQQCSDRRELKFNRIDSGHPTLAQPSLPTNISVLPIPPERRMESLGQAMKNLPKGNIVLHAPDSMKVGDKKKVEANVGFNISPEQLRKQLPEGGQAFEGTLRISPEMVATLNGPGFKISAITPEQQAIAKDFSTIWSWNVEALDDGDQILEATLYVLVDASGSSKRQRIDSYTQKISVSVRDKTWSEWLSGLGKKLDPFKEILAAIGTIVTAVFGWVTFKKDRKPPKKRGSKGK